jgi:hypothetical protein
MFIIAGPTGVDFDIKIIMTVIDFSSSGHKKCESWAINLQDDMNNSGRELYTSTD